MKAKNIKIDIIRTMHRIKLKFYYIMSNLPTIAMLKETSRCQIYCTINNNESQKD